MFLKNMHLFNNIKTIPQIESNGVQLSIPLISRFSSGNVSLQRGNFITKQQLDAKKELIFSHKFI